MIDAVYNLILDGNVTTDCVANDSTFRADFPYWGVANAEMSNTAIPEIVPSNSAVTWIAAVSLLLVSAGGP